MGLLRGMARTAAVAGTATAVSNKVSRRQGNRWAAKEQQSQPAPAPQQPAPVSQPDPEVAQLQQLAGLRDQGILTNAEFEAKKKKILGI